MKIPLQGKPQAASSKAAATKQSPLNRLSKKSLPSRLQI